MKHLIKKIKFECIYLEIQYLICTFKKNKNKSWSWLYSKFSLTGRDQFLFLVEVNSGKLLSCCRLQPAIWIHLSCECFALEKRDSFYSLLTEKKSHSSEHCALCSALAWTLFCRKKKAPAKMPCQDCTCASLIFLQLRVRNLLCLRGSGSAPSVL